MQCQVEERISASLQTYMIHQLLAQNAQKVKKNTFKKLSPMRIEPRPQPGLTCMYR